MSKRPLRMLSYVVQSSWHSCHKPLTLFLQNKESVARLRCSRSKEPMLLS
jgi:hypothetical protein